MIRRYVMTRPTKDKPVKIISHKGPIFYIFWINKLSIDVWFIKIQLFENLESEGAKKEM